MVINTDGLSAEQIAEIEALQVRATELEEKNTNLGDKIYNLKKENKEVKKEIPNEATGLTIEDIKRINKEMEFEKSNPELITNEKFLEYTSRGYSLEDAKTLVEANDSTIKARQIANTTNFTDGELSINTSTYTQEDTAKMSTREYAEFLRNYTAGKVSVK